MQKQTRWNVNQANNKLSVTKQPTKSRDILTRLEFPWSGKYQPKLKLYSFPLLPAVALFVWPLHGPGRWSWGSEFEVPTRLEYLEFEPYFGHGKNPHVLLCYLKQKFLFTSHVLLSVSQLPEAPTAAAMLACRASCEVRKVGLCWAAGLCFGEKNQRRKTFARPWLTQTQNLLERENKGGQLIMRSSLLGNPIRTWAEGT